MEEGRDSATDVVEGVAVVVGGATILANTVCLPAWKGMTLIPVQKKIPNSIFPSSYPSQVK